MPEDRLLTFEHLLATDSTETIDFTGLISEDLTFTGSFDIRRGRVKAFGKLLNALPLPVFLLDRASSIEFANSACAKIHPGYVQIRGRQFWTMVPHREERDRVKGIVEEVFDTRKPRIFEATLQIRDKTISGRMHLRSLRVEGERCLIVLVEDLTHEKTKLRENLRLQEELERRVAERTAELTVANKKLKKEVADRTHAEKELLKARQELERRVLERTAELEKSNERLVDEISQRMEAEKASEQLEDRFRTVFQHSLDAIVVADALDGMIISANRSLETILGYLPDQMVGKHISILHPSTESDSFPITLDDVRPQGAVLEAHDVKRADGSVLPMDLTATLIPWEEGMAILATFRDVSDREAALQALKESEERYRTLFDEAGRAILLETEDGEILDANRAASRLTGYGEANLIGMKMDYLVPRRSPGSTGVAHPAEFPGPTETVIVRKDGIKLPVEMSVAPLKMGNQTLFLSIIHDINDRKRVESLTLAQRDLSTRLSAVSGLSEALQLCMETTLEVSGMDSAGVYLPGLDGDLELAAHKGLPRDWVNEMLRIGPDAHLFRLIMNGRPIYSTCKLMGLAGMASDGRGALEAVAVIPVLYEGHVIACLTIASRSMDEVPVSTRNALEAIFAQIGSSIARIRAEEALLEAHQELEKRVDLRTKELVEANTRLEQEIAQRKAAEKHIRQSLREKEALLQEVHHRVKNNLQIISSLLALQKTQVKDEKTLGVLRDSQSRIRSMAFIHEHLYKSPELSGIAFSDYVKDLAGALWQSYSEVGARIKLVLELEPVILGVSLALTCGLVLNEIVSNCLKHAFPDGRGGEVRIRLKRKDEHEFELSVTDDGVGLPKDIDFRNSQTLGMRLVTNLVELQLRGQLHVSSEQGATIGVTFEDREKAETRRRQ